MGAGARSGARAGNRGGVWGGEVHNLIQSMPHLAPMGDWGLQEGPSGLPALPPLQVTRHPWSPGQGQRAPRGRAGKDGHSSVRSRGPEPGPLAAPQGTARASVRGRLFNRAPTPPVDHRPGEPAPIHAFPALLQTGNAPLLWSSLCLGIGSLLDGLLGPSRKSILCTCFLPPCIPASCLPVWLGPALPFAPRVCPGTRLGPSCRVRAGSPTHAQPGLRSGQRPYPYVRSASPTQDSLPSGWVSCTLAEDPRVPLHCCLPNPCSRAGSAVSLPWSGTAGMGASGDTTRRSPPALPIRPGRAWDADTPRPIRVSSRGERPLSRTHPRPQEAGGECV